MLITKFVLFSIVVAENTISLNQSMINVAFSKRQPFVFRDQSGKLTGIDIRIISKFAKKFNLQIKYIEYNHSLNEIFSKSQTNEDELLRRNLM